MCCWLNKSLILDGSFGFQLKRPRDNFKDQGILVVQWKIICESSSRLSIFESSSYDGKTWNSN